MQSIEPDRIRVAAGIIVDESWQVLLGCRTSPGPYIGKWEFPGGKIRRGESVEAALYRELKEELGISVKSSTPFIKFAYDYPDHKVMLDFRRVDEFKGSPRGLEQQQLRWVKISRLNEIDLLAPNVTVVAKLMDWERANIDA